MRKFTSFRIGSGDEFRIKLLEWSRYFNEVCILDSNGYGKRFPSTHGNHSYDYIAAIGSVKRFSPPVGRVLKSIDAFTDGTGDWLFGHLSYDLKNETEKLFSGHHDRIGFPTASFFVPGYIFIIDGNNLDIGWLEELNSDTEIESIVKRIESLPLPEAFQGDPGHIAAAVPKNKYMEAVNNILAHIRRGDIYEVNFCQEFYSVTASIDPAFTWLKLLGESPTPFSCYYKLDDKYLMCASPERFMKKSGPEIISQPIKGTAPRGKDPGEDNMLKEALASDPKERSENIMITDLVRNDLSVIAERGTVKVDELCSIYPFPRLFQMQSTVSARLVPSTGLSAVIEALFPMGSMTGAPKIRSMEIIEQYECSRRGLYSGTVGYITPGKDFDFNVVIRGIQYNSKKSALSFMVGGAITGLSDPEKEFKECMLKAGAIMKVLGLEK